MLDKSVKRRVDQLKVHCTNHKAGCKWVGELSTVQTHLDSDSGCGYVEVSCTNGCTISEDMQRKDLAKHLEQECPKRWYQCKHCGKRDTYHTITKTHYNECPNYPLDCPNRCGTRKIKPAEMEQHRSNCPLEPVECPFKEAGCQVKVVRQEFENHMANSQQQHLLTLMGAFTVAKADLEAIKVDLEAKQEVIATQVKILRQSSKDLEVAKAHLEAKQEVIATDVKILRQSSRKKQSDLALASIESHLLMKSLRLTDRGPPHTIRMTNFSHYKRSGEVWYSLPFYYGASYKMQLAVYANGTGAGAGTHVSIVLLRMKGEYDDQLSWMPVDERDKFRCPNIDYSTIEAYNIHIRIAAQQSAQKLQAIADFFDDIWDPPVRVSGAEDVWVERSVEMFCDQRSVNQEILLNDSIVLQLDIRMCTLLLWD